MEGIQIGKHEVKLSLFVGDMIDPIAFRIPPEFFSLNTGHFTACPFLSLQPHLPPTIQIPVIKNFLLLACKYYILSCSAICCNDDN